MKAIASALSFRTKAVICALNVANDTHRLSTINEYIKHFHSVSDLKVLDFQLATCGAGAFKKFPTLFN